MNKGHLKITAISQFSITKTTCNVFASLLKLLLACEVASGDALEAYDGVSDLQVPFFFQVSQDSSSEEDFTLTHPEQVVVQFQSSDLGDEATIRDAHRVCACYS